MEVWACLKASTPASRAIRRLANPVEESRRIVMGKLADETPAEPFHFEPNEVQARMMADEQAAAYDVPQHFSGQNTVAPAAPKRPNFDDWADEDAPVIPADDMVTRKVHAWAATVCTIPYQVTWQPENDAKAIEVLLVTEHGASRLRKSAGNWTEPAIDEALEAMRADLMV